MYQIDVATASSTLPAPAAAGTPGYFTDGDLTTPPTIVPADFMNMLMEELLNVLAAVGLAPSKTTYNQLATAIEQLIEARAGNYSIDTGTAGAYVIALSPAVTAYSNGLQVKFRAAHANPGGSQLNAGAGVVPLLRDDGTATQQEDISANAIVSATYDATAGGFLINSIVPSQLGQLAKVNIGSFLQIDGSGNLTLKLGAFLGNDGNGDLTVLLGQGLLADSTGNLALKLADSTLLLDANGLRAAPNSPLLYFMGQM